MTLSYFLAIILAFVLIAAFAAAAHFMPQSIVKVIMAVVYAVMLIGEAFKQIDAFTAEGGYYLWNAPLHFSSTFYISIPLSLFGCKALKRIGQPALFVGGLILFAMMLYTPYSIFGAYPADIFKSAESTHGYFYHMAVILQLAVMISCGWYKPRLYDPAIFAAFVLVYGSYAAPISLKTGFNFAGLVVSYIPFLETIRQTYGYAVYFILYYLGVCAIGVVLIYLYALICRLCKKKDIWGEEL